MMRRSSTFSTERLDGVWSKLYLHHGDMADGNCLARLIKEVEPHEIYNLAAQSHVRVSSDQPVYTSDVTGIGTLRLLEALRDSYYPVRLYQASSSEMYGTNPAGEAFDENTPFKPASPYGVAKVFAHQMVVHYRAAYGIHASCGILFNHESPRRGETFVTRKITRAAARIKLGLQKHLYLGNLEAERDWGYAPDYVEAMWLMLQQDEPDDYVIATGETRSVREFLHAVFGSLGLSVKKHVKTDERLKRPEEVNWLKGNARKAKQKLGWEPRCSFEDLVRIMVDEDMRLAEREARADGKKENSRNWRNWISWT
jgi:GDPmannose 4,6-dehydratase